MSMKAWVLRKTAKKYEILYESVPKPAARENEVLIKIIAVSLNRRDYWITCPGMYPANWITEGSIVGSDCCGVVIEAGDNQNDHWVGKEVIINPMTDWSKGVQSLLGLLPSPGTFAEYIAAPVELLHEKPSHLSAEQAASLPIAAVTAYRALVVKGCVKAGDNVLVTGIGSGVALFSLQFGISLGANVYITSSSQEKITKAKELGAKEGFNYNQDSWLTELKASCPGGIDCVIDGAAGTPWKDLINKVMNYEGRIVSFGATGSQTQEILVPHLFLKNIDIKGTSMGTQEDFAAMVSFVNKMKLEPILDKVRPISELKKSLEFMGSMNHFGKFVLTVEKDAQL